MTRRRLHLSLVLCLLAWLTGCTKTGNAPAILPIAPAVAAAPTKGGGDADAIHGGDPLDLKLRSLREIFQSAVSHIQTGQRIENLGAPLTNCNDFPVLTLCQALNAPAEQRREARELILRNISQLVAFSGDPKIRLLPSEQQPTQANPDGSVRSVMAWTKLTEAGADLYFHSSTYNLKDLELLSLVAHEMGHVLQDARYGRISDNQTIAGMTSPSGDGRYLLDLAAAEIVVFAYETILKSDPNTLLGTGKGFLPGKQVMKHGSAFNQQATYADFNGDGRDDLLYVGTRNEIWVSTFNGTNFNLAAVGVEFGGWYEPGHVDYVSLNDDRRIDVLFRDAENHLLGCFSNGSKFVDCRTVLTLPGVFGDGEMVVGDFDGDHLSDVVYRDHSNLARVYRFDGQSYQLFASIALKGIFETSRLRVTNMVANADGIRRDDLMLRDGDNNFWLYRAHAQGFDAGQLVMTHGGAVTFGQPVYADINGDGLQDLIYLGGDNRVWINLSDGTQLLPVQQAADLGFDGDPNRRIFAGDFNKDGRADLLFQRVEAQSTAFEVLYGQPDGSLTASKFAFTVPYTVVKGQVQIADTDGDGRDDAVIQTLDSAFNLFIAIEGR